MSVDRSEEVAEVLAVLREPKPYDVEKHRREYAELAVQSQDSDESNEHCRNVAQGFLIRMFGAYAAIEPILEAVRSGSLLAIVQAVADYDALPDPNFIPVPPPHLRARVMTTPSPADKEATEEHPRYSMVLHDDGSATPLYFITCDSGWKQEIVCERMYQWAAAWLLDVLSGRPFAPEKKR